MNNPLITYHCVSFNRLKMLKNMLLSFSQCNMYENFEFIVIDHGSTDGTIEFLEGIKSNEEFKYFGNRIIPRIYNEKDYIRELAQKGICLNGGRRIGEGFFGKYRNEARSVAKGDYFIDIPDDHQFIVRHDWVQDMMDIFDDRVQKAGRDDIGSLVFRTRHLYRILKENNSTHPLERTDNGVEYYICKNKGYDDYHIMSRENSESMSPFFQPDTLSTKDEISKWNDTHDLTYDSRHYSYYLQKTKELGLNKIMMKYPITHDLVNDRPNRKGGLMAPITSIESLKKKFSKLDRIPSVCEVDSFLGI